MILVALLFVFFRPKSWEGFDTVPNSFFIPRIAPGGFEQDSVLSPGAAMNIGNEKLVMSAALPPMKLEEAEERWGTMNSETCFRSDIGESLKKTRNFLQRTNNYQHEYPDSCSAPNHEFVGTFYTPWNGVGNKPSGGGNYPPSTQCQPVEAS